jgi:nicotinamidase-related amidase
MAISLDSLKEVSFRFSARIIEKSLTEARAKGRPTAFLCHSHYDHDMAEGLQVLLNEHGWNLYIDWQDTQMPETPNQETAERIQKKIKDLDWFLFLATPNSTLS